MKTIDITTTQKVTIEYNLAGLQNRFFAFFVDIMVISGLSLMILVVFEGLLGVHDSIITYGIQLPIFFFYTLVSEILMDGQTLGKKAVGIKVVKLNGDAASASDYLIRWVFRMIDIYGSIGTIGSLLVTSSANAQRLGGLASNTAVIQVKFNLRFRLEDIEKISSIDDYVPQYPEVRQLSEQDMLLIKSVVTRANKYRNPAHNQVIKELTERLAMVLNLGKTPRNKMAFLKTLIRDYIVLTR